jgi:hypothetical protein
MKASRFAHESGYVLFGRYAYAGVVITWNVITNIALTMLVYTTLDRYGNIELPYSRSFVLLGSLPNHGWYQGRCHHIGSHFHRYDSHIT